MGDVMQNIGQNEAQQQQDLIQKLLSKALQPRKAGPQPQPEQVRSMTPSQPGTQGLVTNLFGLIQKHAAQSKQQQLDHATSRIKSLSDAITDAYEIAEGDDAKAKQIFMESPSVKALMSKEGQKDMKQMEKLLQYDFLNPEKSKTVWHQALERVAQISGAENAMKGIRHLMGQHKDKMAEEVRKQGEAQKGQSQAKELAGTMFQGARPQQIDPAKSLPALVSSTGADIRRREVELHQDWRDEQRRNFARSIDSIKDPKQKMLARASQAMMDGDEDEANKYIDQATKLFTASAKPTAMSRNKAIDDAVNSDDPAKKAAAVRWLNEDERRQMAVLSQRGLAFGMGRLYNWYNQETGETAPMNGFQAEAAIKQGEHWTMSTPVSTQLLLPAQQIVSSMNMPNPETGKSLRADLTDDMSAFDNAKDRDIITRVLRENPSVYAQDPNTLGVWLDQNLTSKLSDGGQKLVRDLKLYAEVFNRSAAITGQTRTEMNTMMLLALLPNERTPSKAYGMQQLQASFNYLDGMVQAPILGGGRFKPGAKTDAPKADKPKADESGDVVIDLRKKKPN